MTPKTVAAFRLSRPSPCWSSDPLSPFALHTAFPCSLGGRGSADSSGDSVAVGLAPRRRSRVPCGAARLKRDGGAPFLPWHWCAPNRPSSGGYAPRKSYGPFPMARLSDAVAVRVRLHRWRLGCRPSSFHPITRASQDGSVSVFEGLLLFQHALVPCVFRHPVRWMAQRSSSEPLLVVSGIQHRVSAAHPFTAHGSAPSVVLCGCTSPQSVPSHFSNSTGVRPCTACAFAGYLCSGLPKG